MTIEEKIGKGKKLTAQEVAAKSRLELRTSTVNVGLLAESPIIVGQIVDNLIPKSILDPGPMIVRFDTKTIAVPHADDEWELLQRKGTSGAGTLVDSDVFGPIATRPEFVDIPVPTTGLLDDDLTKMSTTYQFQFIHYKGSDGNPDETAWVTAEIDRTAPEEDKVSGVKYKPEALIFLNLPAPRLIDDEWLKNNSQLSLSVNIGYEFYRPDDVIDIFIDTNYGAGTAVHSQPLTSATVNIPQAQLPKLDSLYFIWYVLRDVVGNESDPALSGSFNVRRLPPPSLIPCVIPKGISPDVIDLEDIETPVFVNVPYTTNGNDNDRIIASVTNGTLPISLGNQPLGTAPRTLQFQITTSRLLALWGNATAEVPITANYKFSRGLEPLIDSVDTNSALDFTYRGPINPVFPGRENPNMTKVTILGDSKTPNHIIADDRGKNAEISTPMITAPVVWTPIGDETAKLWFNGVAVDTQLLTAGAVTPLSFTLLPAVIDLAGPGTKIAYWTIEETGGRNVMKSLDTEVTIDNVRVALPAPSVRLFNNLVSCRYLTLGDRELPVTVPIDATYMPTNTVVTLKSVGTSDSQGLIEIPGTEFSKTYTITGSETGGQFVENIQPYLTKLKPIQPPFSSGLPNGYIKIWYEVTIFGVPTPSLEFLNEVSLLNDSGNYCEGTPTN
ncbi:hypothetical protein IAI51_13460 [Pseudomonas sp. N40(2020)]|uniref:hypothetical protein n=1 Tax=Pseudomonas sp. N40(2020) TaxID=2767798 RepID=UPI00165727B2|nr:hypothetical protein [Pseudomonas sp. N40(2020)]MBC8997537.1 hypothetical protein [Pseudomonas sp. N40(2020)]